MLNYAVVRTSNTRKKQTVYSAHSNRGEAEESIRLAKLAEANYLQPYWIDYEIKEIL